jgi:hypothetical protein
MQDAVRAGLCLGMLVGFAVASGCGGESATQKCELTIVTTVAPASATANHSAAPPGNQVQFVETDAPTAPAGCAVPAWIVRDFPAWSNPDPIDITISSADDATNGAAVCKGATAGAVTLTSTMNPGNGNAPVTRSVQLTCE